MPANFSKLALEAHGGVNPRLKTVLVAWEAG